MTANLPDVNFLIALSWTNHIHHHAARSWFAEHMGEGFATCLITESGFVRLSMNPAVVGEAVSFETALSALRTYSNLPNHQFWPADMDFISMTKELPVAGYRQITDAYLLALAQLRGGRLITFDRKMRELAEADPKLQKHLILIEANN